MTQAYSNPRPFRTREEALADAREDSEEAS